MYFQYIQVLSRTPRFLYVSYVTPTPWHLAIIGASATGRAARAGSSVRHILDDLFAHVEGPPPGGAPRALHDPCPRSVVSSCASRDLSTPARPAVVSNPRGEPHHFLNHHFCVALFYPQFLPGSNLGITLFLSPRFTRAFVVFWYPVPFGLFGESGGLTRCFYLLSTRPLPSLSWERSVSFHRRSMQSQRPELFLLRRRSFLRRLGIGIPSTLPVRFRIPKKLALDVFSPSCVCFKSGMKF